MWSFCFVVHTSQNKTQLFCFETIFSRQLFTASDSIPPALLSLFLHSLSILLLFSTFSLMPLIDLRRPVKEQTFCLPVTLHHSVQLALYGHANTYSHICTKNLTVCTVVHTHTMIAYSLNIQMKKKIKMCNLFPHPISITSKQLIRRTKYLTEIALKPNVMTPWLYSAVKTEVRFLSGLLWKKALLQATEPIYRNSLTHSLTH